MLHKTRGIVFKFFKYRDTSIIAKIYTEEFGLQSYIVNGVRSTKAKSKAAFFQPLTLLDLVVYKKPNTDIQRISEIKCTYPLKNIPYDISKSSIAVFLTEVIYKSIKEDEADALLFNFLDGSIKQFDELDNKNLNFHLIFLIKLTHYLGFGIEDTNQFLHIDNDKTHEQLEKLIAADYQDHIELNNSIRRLILEDLIQFYRKHVDGMSELKSIDVLRTILGK